MTSLENLFSVVKQIPRGRVMSYGQVGQLLDRPVSGLLVGRWMFQCPQHVPWWRVVGASGDILISKRDANLGNRQIELLKQEKVFLTDNRVPPSYFWNPYD